MNMPTYIRKTLLHITLLSLPATLFAQGLKITNGCRFIVSGSVKLVLHNASFANEGQFIPGNGTLSFTGNLNAFITGNTTIPLQHVILNKTSGATVSMLQDAALNGVITMSNGNLLLNNQTLNLESAASISGESSQSYITGDTAGRISITGSSFTPLNAFNPGNIGVALTSPIAPGRFVVERKHAPVALSSGLQSIRRSFFIAATNNTSLNATLRFSYLDTELNGHSESGLIVWMESDISNGWAPIGKDNNDAGANWVEKTGLDHWGRFTIADPDGPAGPRMLTQTRQQNTMAATGKVSIYPNPSHDWFTMKLVSKQENDILFTMYDHSGRLLQQKRIQIHAGVNIIQWDVSTYAAGVYYIAGENSGMKNIKIIKE